MLGTGWCRRAGVVMRGIHSVRVYGLFFRERCGVMVDGVDE